MGDLCRWLCATPIRPTFLICKYICRSITGFASHYHQRCPQSLNLFSSPLFTRVFLRHHTPLLQTTSTACSCVSLQLWSSQEVE